MYSPDGRWWWNGAQWVPVQAAAAYRTRYEETSWTRQLQVAALALQAVALAAGVFIFPAVMSQAITNNPGFSDPALRSDPQTVAFLRNVLTATIGFAVVFSLVLLAVVVLGVIKLWRWLFWYLMISYFLAVLSIPGNLTYVFGNGPIRLPAWILLLEIPIALAEIGLAIWMVIALRRYGAWARRTIVEAV